MIDVSLKRLTDTVKAPRALACARGHLVIVFYDYHLNMPESSRAAYYLYRSAPIVDALVLADPSRGLIWHQGGCGKCGAPFANKCKDVFRGMGDRDLLDAASAVHRVAGNVGAVAVIKEGMSVQALAAFNGEVHGVHWWHTQRRHAPRTLDQILGAPAR